MLLPPSDLGHKLESNRLTIFSKLKFLIKRMARDKRQGVPAPCKPSLQLPGCSRAGPSPGCWERRMYNGRKKPALQAPRKEAKGTYLNPQREPEIRNSLPHRASETVPSGRQVFRCYREPGEPGELQVALPAFPGLSLPSEQPRICSHSGGDDSSCVLSSSPA